MISMKIIHILAIAITIAIAISVAIPILTGPRGGEQTYTTTTQPPGRGDRGGLDTISPTTTKPGETQITTTPVAIQTPAIPVTTTETRAVTTTPLITQTRPRYPEYSDPLFMVVTTPRVYAEYGGVFDLNITVVSLNGFKDPVDLYVLGLASGYGFSDIKPIDHSLSPQRIRPGEISRARFALDTSIPPGEYILLIYGSSGDLVSTAPVRLTIYPKPFYAIVAEPVGPNGEPLSYVVAGKPFNLSVKVIPVGGEYKAHVRLDLWKRGSLSGVVIHKIWGELEGIPPFNVTITVEITDAWSGFDYSRQSSNYDARYIMITDSPGFSKAVLIFNNEPSQRRGGLLETILSIIFLPIGFALGLAIGFALLPILPQAFQDLVTGSIVAFAPWILGSVYPKAPLKAISIATNGNGFEYYAKVPVLSEGKKASLIIPQANIEARGDQDLSIPFFAVVRTNTTSDTVSIGASIKGGERLAVRIANHTRERGDGYYLSYLTGYVTIPRDMLGKAESLDIEIWVSSNNIFLDRVSLSTRITRTTIHEGPYIALKGKLVIAPLISGEQDLREASIEIRETQIFNLTSKELITAQPDTVIERIWVARSGDTLLLIIKTKEEPRYPFSIEYMITSPTGLSLGWRLYILPTGS